MRADDTFSLISKIHRGMEQLVLDELNKAGVDGIVPSHGNILVVLFMQKKASMKELSLRIGKSPQTVTTLVKKLADFGCVETEKLGSDKRTIMVSLTEKGKALKETFVSISEKLYQTQYKGMTQAEIDALRKLLKKMVSNFEENLG